MLAEGCLRNTSPNKETSAACSLARSSTKWEPLFVRSLQMTLASQYERRYVTGSFRHSCWLQVRVQSYKTQNLMAYGNKPISAHGNVARRALGGKNKVGATRAIVARDMRTVQVLRMLCVKEAGLLTH
jgi:hypothetical protein